jgi:hypothetical protein
MPLNHSFRCNFSHKVYDQPHKVASISFYPRLSTESQKTRYSYFVVAGTASYMRFFRKDNIVENNIECLDSYQIPVRSRSNLAYNLTSGKFEDAVTDFPENGTAFNVFLQSMTGRGPLVLYTTFSPNGSFFAYATSDGYIGILDFQLQEKKAATIATDNHKAANDAFWEMIDAIARKEPGPNMLGRTQPIRGWYQKVVPYEYVLAIIDEMSLGDAENAVEAMLAPEDKERAMKIRCDPLRFLREAFENPEKLLDLMRCTGTIITGSRATEYFCRGACVPSSDWDFYCPSDIETVALFTYHLSRMGVEWHSLERSEEEFPDYSAMGFHLLKGTLEHNDRAIDIQCIWNKRQHCTATSSLLHFHSTLVQCFISGFAAVSLYDKYTSSKQVIHWPANDTNISRGQRHRKYYSGWALELDDRGEFKEYLPSSETKPHNELKILEKYRHRGFEFVEYLSKGEIAHGNGHREIGCYGGRFRSIGDSGCRKVSFKTYLKHDQWDIPFDAYYQALDYISWYETEYKTIPIGGILDVDFPYERKSYTHFDKGWSGSNQLFDPMITSYTGEMVNNPAPWLNQDFRRGDFHRFFYAYRYPC